MKRILSFILALSVLAFMLASCNVTDNTDSSTSTETKATDETTDISSDTVTDLGTDDSSDSSTDSSTDTSANILDNKNASPTVNSFEVSREKEVCYYEPLVLGDYIGRRVPSANGNILYETDFDFGWYYRVIKNYEELEGLVESPENVEPSLFDDCYILLVSYYDRTTSRYKILGFRDLIFNEESKELTITMDGVFSGDVGEMEWVYNLYLAVPKSSVDFSTLTNGNLKCIFNKTSQTAYGYVFNSTEIYGVQSGSTWLFKSAYELRNKLEELEPQLEIPDAIEDILRDDLEESYPINPDEQVKNEYVFLLTYREVCDVCDCCTELLGFDNLRLENGVPYVTLKVIGNHTEECKPYSERLWVYYIESDVAFEKETQIIVEVEKQTVKHLTSYSKISKEDFYKYDHFYVLIQ